jgi:hypothetical protein
MSLFTVSQGIALLISGVLAARLGIVPIFYGSAVLLLLVAVVGWWRLENVRPDPEPAEAGGVREPVAPRPGALSATATAQPDTPLDIS